MKKKALTTTTTTAVISTRRGRGRKTSYFPAKKVTFGRNIW